MRAFGVPLGGTLTNEALLTTLGSPAIACASCSGVAPVTVAADDADVVPTRPVEAAVNARQPRMPTNTCRQRVAVRRCLTAPPSSNTTAPRTVRTLGKPVKNADARPHT
jgi:hypothetical protein